MEWRGGKGRAGQGRVPDCLGGLSRVGISSRSTRPWNGQPPSFKLRVSVVTLMLTMSLHETQVQIVGPTVLTFPCASL